MSSTISQTELQSVPKKDDGQISPRTSSPHAKRPRHLIRSSSVDKIIKFNAYICSQNYYILPSLLVWLKTSQNALTGQTEKSIAYVKSAFFASALYRTLQERFSKVSLPVTTAQWLSACGACLNALSELRVPSPPIAFSPLLDRLRERLVVAAVYVSLAVIVAQLLTCVLILCFVFVPVGFVFMVCCMYAMGHIAAIAMFHHMRQEERKHRTHEGCRTPVQVKPKVLGDRTISNVNLF